MQTRVIESTDPTSILQASGILASGGLVVFPTETVYGIGASLANEEALKHIYQAKGRPSNNPLIIHIAHQDILPTLVTSITPLEQKLIDLFWPGPLTIIFPKQAHVSSVASGGLDTIAVRMPSHPVAHALLETLGSPIAAPSANISGRPSATTGSDAFVDLQGSVDLIIDDGISSGGLESTVIRIINDTIHILRPGTITKEVLKEKTGAEVIYAEKADDLHASPGTQYRHYAPNAPLILCESMEALLSRAQQEKELGHTVGVLTTTENKGSYINYEPYVYNLGSRTNLAEVSQHIYIGLRFFNTTPVDIILGETFPPEDLGRAIMDKLTKASQA